MNPKDLDGFKLNIILSDYKDPKKVYNCPCLLPKDCLHMSREELLKAIGPHLTDAVYDLLQHKPFRKNLENPKSNLILST